MDASSAVPSTETMSHFWKDLGRGLLYAVPVVAVAGLGAREVIRLRALNHESEARRLTAERALARAEERLAAVHRVDDQTLAARLRAAADAAETQGAAEERLTRVVEFLKQEVATAETTIEALRRGGAPPEAGPAAAPTDAAGTAALLREISRLNGEIEALRSAPSTGGNR
jgi:hypothetical protein